MSISHDAFEPDEIPHVETLLSRLEYLESRKNRTAYIVAEAAATRWALTVLGASLPPAPAPSTPSRRPVVIPEVYRSGRRP
jgi:hypothetical protein